MNIVFNAGEGTASCVTTQACEKFYKSAGGAADVRISLNIAEGAHLFWLPQESILFRGARVQREIDVYLAGGDSRLTMLEAVLLGRRSAKERFDEGMFKDHWRVFVNGDLAHAEALFLKPGQDQNLTTAARCGEYCALATALVVAPGAGDRIDALRGALSNDSLGLSGVSAWRVGETEKLVIRMMAKDGYQLRKQLAPIIPMLTEGRTAPRIWAT